MKLVLALLGAAVAVKQEVFRTCDQNPFCARNRHYAQQQRELHFDSPYTLTDLKFDDHVQGTLVKSTPHKQIELEFSLEFLEGLVHLTVDEPLASREAAIKSDLTAKQRFSPAPFMLDTSNFPERTKFKHKQTATSLTLLSGDLELQLQLQPFELRLLSNGTEEIALNSESLLNFEHARREGADERNSWESDVGAWTDTFDKFVDTKSRGPESVGLDVVFPGYQHVFGIPEHADVLNLRSTRGRSEPYRLYNVDIFEYETNSPMPMYGSIPFMIAHKPGRSAGVFWLNAADSYIDIDRSDAGTSTHWFSESGKMDLYLLVGESPAAVLAQYARLTGAAALPQQFATAYHQCRWNYNSEEDVLQVNANFDEHSIPYDVIWLDVEYTINKRYFTWNEDTFPDPTRMLGQLDKQSRKLVTIIDPHIKVGNENRVYNDLKAQSLAVLDAQAKTPFEGHCWPGNSIWVDAFNPDVQKYWDSLHAMGGVLEGSSHNLHIWNDMNEPSVFSGPETSAPKDIVHFGGWQHRDVHNLYGQEFINRTFEAMYSRYAGEQRPFILTRAFFAGAQKLAAMWTGDNIADWQYLKQAIPQVLTLGSVGMPFAGADVGGFFGNPDTELLTRWYQSGIWYPFFRAHAHIDSRRREPFLLDGEHQQIIKDAIELRYRLLPTFYTAFYRASTDLSPVLRPVYYEVPGNAASFGIDDAFFLGDSIYVKPVSDPGQQSITLYILEDEYYYNYWTGSKVQGPTNITQRVHLDTIPMYARGGRIHVRRDRPRRSSELMHLDPFTIVVAVGKDGTARGELYLDDGVSYKYKDGEYLLAEFNYDASKGTISSTVVHSGFSCDLHVEKIIVLGADASSAGSAGSAFDVLKTPGGFVVRNPKVKIADGWTINLN